MLRRRLFMGASAAFAMLVLILDAKTALNGAYQGVHMCLYTVIPSLFPFFVVSILLTGCLTGLALPILAPLERLCRLPCGSASILLTGLLGGYPVGAQATAQAYYQGSIAKEDAQRMLAFSSNAGPAFLFGLIGQQFTHPWMPWVLWLVHILSAITVGALLPGKHASASALPQKDAPDITEAVTKSIRVMAGVCGWIVVMRTVTAFLERWFFFLLPPALQVVLTGLLELANGCVALPAIENEGMRAIICSGLLAFGGICVSLQTAAVTRGLSMRLYFPGKILQCSISVVLTGILQYFLLGTGFRTALNWLFWAIIVVIFAMIPIIYKITAKNSSKLDAVGV